MSDYEEDYEFYTYEVGIIHETALAYRVCEEDSTYEFWVPKSEMEDEHVTDDKMIFSIPEWLHLNIRKGFKEHMAELKTNLIRKEKAKDALEALNEM